MSGPEKCYVARCGKCGAEARFWIGPHRSEWPFPIQCGCGRQITIADVHTIQHAPGQSDQIAHIPMPQRKSLVGVRSFVRFGAGEYIEVTTL